ncbi:MAG: Stp1/IreP family PP2C-type Ser/Thr phosphatase [Actinomycetota bacterium]
MRVVAGAATDIGKVREGNEDRYLSDDPLFAVADGMGGHRGGEVASRLALDILEDLFRRDRGSSLTGKVQEANRAVFERSQRDRKVAGMGTTLTAAVLEKDQVRLAHVGDSRAYLFRDDELQLLTEDHTLVRRMTEQGEITKEEAETHPYRSVLTRALGVDPRVAVDEALLELREADRLLLCTDGLTGMVAEEQIQAILKETRDPQEAADHLIRAANTAGGIDNITVVVLDFEADDRDQVDLEAGAHEATEKGPAGVRSGGGDGKASGAPPPAHPTRARRVSLGRIAVYAGVPAAVLVIGLVGLRFYLDSQWYVGAHNGHVAVFRGIPVEVAGFELHEPVVVTTLSAEDAQGLALYEDLEEGITAEDRADADAIVEQIRVDLSRLVPEPAA